MNITRDQARHVANLARLDLTDEEIERLAGDMTSILNYIDKLAELDTDDVEPTSSVVTMTSALRDDDVTCEPRPEDAVANAPSREDHFFVVPSIIE